MTYDIPEIVFKKVYLYNITRANVCPFTSSHSEMFLVKGVLKISIKFTREYPFQSVILIKLESNLIEITLRH